MSEGRIPLVFDTDIGGDIDDLYALYLALFHPRLDLRAVTTAHMNTLLKARLTAKALRIAGRTDIPVGAGIGLSQARQAHGYQHPAGDTAEGYARFVTEADPEFEATYPTARQVLNHALTDCEKPVAIVSVGAYSNVADILGPRPETLRDNIRCIALMGGETERCRVEHNVLCDPEAAEIVLNSGLQVFLGTWQITSRLQMTMEQVSEEFGDTDNPVFEAIAECTEIWAPRRGWKPGPVLYDLVPLLWLADNSLVQTRASTIHVELRGQYTRGQTVRTDDDGPVAESVDLDAEALMRQYLEILHRGAAQIDAH